MTWKHFEAIAAAFAATRPDLPTYRRLQWTLDVQQVARSLKQLNPDFDRDRFVDACGQ